MTLHKTTDVSFGAAIASLVVGALAPGLKLTADQRKRIVDRFNDTMIQDVVRVALPPKSEDDSDLVGGETNA